MLMAQTEHLPAWSCNALSWKTQQCRFSCVRFSRLLCVELQKSYVHVCVCANAVCYRGFLVVYEFLQNMCIRIYTFVYEYICIYYYMRCFIFFTHNSTLTIDSSAHANPRHRLLPHHRTCCRHSSQDLAPQT